ncbi:DUF362 domain-containing protein, partial [bacterium]|nr:DUF362 domain-containing protein [bacterium]
MVKIPSDELINRREFLRRLTVVGGAAALNVVLQGCSNTEKSQALPSQSPALTVTPTFTSRIPTLTMPPTNALQSTEPTTVPTSAATEIVNDGKARIAFVKTTDRAEGVRQAIDLLGINPVSGKSVFLKPNFNSADPTPGSTHMEVLATLVATLKDMGALEITIGDRSGMGNTRQVMERLGVFKLAEEIGFTPMVFDDLSADGWIMVQ